MATTRITRTPQLPQSQVSDWRTRLIHRRAYLAPTSRQLATSRSIPVAGQPYQDGTTYRGARGHSGYRAATRNLEVGEGETDERGEEEVQEQEEDEEVWEQEQKYDEEVQEQERVPETFEEDEGYPGGKPVEYGEEEEEGYTAQNDEDYEAGEPVEEGEDEDEDDGGYGYQAPAAPRRWGR